MFKSLLLAIGLFGYACLSPSTGWAAGGLWTIDALVRHGLENNPELRYYQAEVEAARGQRTQAGLWANPEFSGEYGERRIKDGTGRLTDEGTTRAFSLAQTFEFPGKGSLRKAIAAKNVELAELGLRQFRWALEGRIRQSALTYAGAVAQAEVAGEISERGTALVALLKKRPLAGTQQLLELRIIESSLMELRQAAKETTLAREEARLTLTGLLGLPASQALAVEPDVRVPHGPVPELNQLVLAGLARNLPLRIRTVELEKAGKELSAARWEVAPDFSVGPFFSQDKAGDTEENLGATVSVTVPLWNWNQGNIATARARRAQAEALLQAARQQVEGEIARQHRAYQLHLRQWGEMAPGAVDTMRQAADLADRQYRTGAIGMPLYLEVQRTYLNTCRIRHETLRDVWESWLDLQLLTHGAVEDARDEKNPWKEKQP